MEEEKTSKNKKQLVIGVSVLLLVSLLLLGLTYAYYRTKIIGNSGEKSVNLTSQNLEVTYEDGTGNITGDSIEPGYTNADNPKTFTVRNNGAVKANYRKLVEVLDDYTFQVRSDING